MTLDEEIVNKQDEIDQKQQEVDQKQAEYDQRWADLKSRMRAMQRLNDGGSIALLVQCHQPVPAADLCHHIGADRYQGRQHLPAA